MQVGTLLPSAASLNRAKALNMSIARALAEAGECSSYAPEVARCCERIVSQIHTPEGRDPEALLRGGWFCKRRLCPICEARLARMRRFCILRGLRDFREVFPTHKAILVTLTVRNVPLGELRAEVQRLHKGWHLLTKRKEFPTPYWVRRTEITLGKPSRPADIPAGPFEAALQGAEKDPRRYELKEGIAPPADELVETESIDIKKSGGLIPLHAHPHIHALLLVPASYFGKNYVKQSLWTSLWADVMRLTYQPVVDVRRAYRKGSAAGTGVDAFDAAIEAAKYVVKVSDVLALGPEIWTYAQAVRGLRLFQSSKALRPFISDRDPEEEDLIDAAEGIPPWELSGPISALWSVDQNAYLITP